MSDLHPLLAQLIGSGTGATTPAARAGGALAYVRVSTDMQEDKGLSIPAQRKAVEEFAAAHDLPVLETYIEAASSFQDEAKRVEFQRMLARAKADPQVAVVLVHESSRFCRHPWRTPQLIGELQDAGVRVVSATEPEYDVNTVMGMWMQKVMEAKNASYSMEVAFHTRKGMRQNAHARDAQSGWCYKNGGRPAWGYRTVRRESTDLRGRPRFKAVWALNTEEVAGRPVWEWTREVLLRAGQGASLDSLRDLLNGAGVPTATGGAWCNSTLHSLLEPHMLLQYAGHGTWAVRKKRRRRWNEASDWEVVPNAHPTIITDDEAKAVAQAREQARAVYRKPAERGSKRRTEGSPYLLTGGLFTCRRCGSNMIGHRNRGYSYYACSASQYRRGQGCGKGAMVDQPALESAVWQQVSRWLVLLAPGGRLLQDANRALRRDWRANGGRATADAKQQLVAVEKRIANVRGAIEEGISDVKWASARLQELHAEQDRLQGQSGAVSAEPPVIDGKVLARYASDLPRLLEEATDRERRELVRQFVERMELDPETREVEVQMRLPANCANQLEAAAGVEPANKGFADLCLATWLRRP